MAVSNAKRRKQSANIIKARGANPADILATGIGENDRMRVGIVEVRNVMATSRESIKRPFNAARLDMGEYSPCSTHALEIEKTLKGWNGE